MCMASEDTNEESRYLGEPIEYDGYKIEGSKRYAGKAKSSLC
jgi:hypothetical protein